MSAHRCRAVLLTILLALAAGCGDDDAKESAPTGTDSTQETRPDASTSLPEGEEPTAGQPFADPQGAYELNVDPDWTANHGQFIAEVEVWLLGAAEDGFTPNVNILTQKVGDTDLEAYLDVSLRSAEQTIEDFRLNDRERSVGTRGDQLAILDYSGSQGDQSLRFFQVITLRSGEAIVATLTTPRNSFTDLRDEVKPYLLTLHAT